MRGHLSRLGAEDRAEWRLITQQIEEVRGKLRDARGRVLAAQEGSPEFIRALADETFNEGLLLGLQSRQELLGTKTIRELLQ